jgi:hypothetical protein
MTGGDACCALTIYRENRIQESEFRIQEKSTSCLFSSTGVTDPAMSIYRENPHTLSFHNIPSFRKQEEGMFMFGIDAFFPKSFFRSRPIMNFC